MEYDFRNLESKWRKNWQERGTYHVKEDASKPKYYVLDMFPYPSGAGLHVGHPLGYIASDIYARYKRLQGFNVLHPMGYDSFGLPAEQYAIQTGQHPAITTEENIARYRQQLDQIGFSFDWSREVRTSAPEYYKWTQWIFKQLFDCYYDLKTNKAERISQLIHQFETEGNVNIQAVTDYEGQFSSNDWSGFTAQQKEEIIQAYRLAYLAESWVNWCPALGTVLANDEIVNGVSERGGHPVEQKRMRQWSMRIKAYAERLLEGLDRIDWSDSIKEQQRNWIGKSQGASVTFAIENSSETIEVFTTRPDTIFGVSFMVLAPEHPLVNQLVSAECKSAVEQYQKEAGLKSERDRQADVKNITGQALGAYAIHPFTGERIPIWIGDYVLASYGTGAVMAVPCGDQRDYDFAKHFGLEIKNIFADTDISEQAYTEKDAHIVHSDFLNGLEAKAAMKKAIEAIEGKGIGKGKTNFRLRDAVFSRQRYWGEPFPVSYTNEIPSLISDDLLPIELPEVDKYLPTEDGEPPLARANKEAWNHFQGDRMEYNTMPGWAGSSWYFLRYMDPKNEQEFVSKEKVEYWKNVDLYIGGSEHATGHLLYSRFWTKFLYDQGYIPFDEPFEKLINQGMILGKSALAFLDADGKMHSYDMIANDLSNYREVRILIDLIQDDESIDLDGLRKWQPQFEHMSFVTNEQGKIIVKREVDKMSKRWYNVVTPDDLCDKYGADTLRMYEMFLGPLEQSKPWDTKGITGVHGFLKKYWRLFHQNGSFEVSEGEASKEAMKSLHKTIKRLRDDLDRYSFNTGVSSFMICVNELTDQKCNNREVLTQLSILMSPYAPHITDEIWSKLKEDDSSIFDQTYPVFEEEYLKESDFEYPVSFNGKLRFKVSLSVELSSKEIEAHILNMPEAQKYLEGKTPKKTIIVPGRIVNFVI
ncbi:MAG: leucine--tRNA ligase [Crocinitomicaceae bacterium]|jgi:leucyl-tRNA synthetase|nr:leucine--tRNA ligase [Crocinitomicaceae bacterium]